MYIDIYRYVYRSRGAGDMPHRYTLTFYTACIPVFADLLQSKAAVALLTRASAGHGCLWVAAWFPFKRCVCLCVCVFVCVCLNEQIHICMYL